MLKRRAAVVCLSFLGLFAAQACLQAQEPAAKPTIAAGISEVRARDFVNALVTLNDVVAQLETRPQESATLARAHAYRAAAFVGLEQPEWAKAAALLSLKADPAVVIDAAEFGPGVAALFEAARRPARDPEATGQAAEAAGRFQDAFLAYLSAIQSLPEPPPAADDQRLRERIIKVVQKLEPKPTIPEEAKARLARATAVLDDAGSSDAAAAQAVTELRKAIRVAPWWPEATVALMKGMQRQGQFDAALINLNLYQLADPAGYAAAVAATSAATAASRGPDAAPEPAPAATAMATAMIYVYFPHATRALGVKSKMKCDGQVVADLAHEHFVMVNAPAGFHVVEFKGRKAEGSFEGGKKHYIRVGIEGYPAHFALHVTDPDKAVAEMREKQVLPNEDKNTFATECTAVAAAPGRRRF